MNKPRFELTEDGCSRCHEEFIGPPYVDHMQLHMTGWSEVWCGPECHEADAEAAYHRSVDDYYGGSRDGGEAKFRRDMIDAGRGHQLK